MTITARHIRDTLTGYLAAHPDETAALTPVLGLLDAGADIATRKEFRGHATAGAVLVNDLGLVLHVHHRVLGTWLLPGGHLEDTDETLLGAALRELSEETGIPAGAVNPMGDGPLHIDVHPIPANDAKSEPEHQHFDFRFLFHTTADIAELQMEEVTAATWRPAESLHDQHLRRRLPIGKTKARSRRARPSHSQWPSG
ncbi:NUDIX hydrolase [Sphaerisporangium sp. NPDC049003]|uniref:NUDIX hydrolase n=1 Tax=Sphaerisporangium sp. NPDC049003 TaxID=3364517 RepID=UPI00371A4A4C